MIIVNAPIQRDFIIELLENADIDGMTYKLTQQQGMKLTFETNASDETVAMKKAKELIKSTQVGSVLYFQMSVSS